MVALDGVENLENEVLALVKLRADTEHLASGLHPWALGIGLRKHHAVVSLEVVKTLLCHLRLRRYVLLTWHSKMLSRKIPECLLGAEARQWRTAKITVVK